jgi:CheY-like chemotaxis protein
LARAGAAAMKSLRAKLVTPLEKEMSARLGDAPVAEENSFTVSENNFTAQENGFAAEEETAAPQNFFAEGALDADALYAEYSSGAAQDLAQPEAVGDSDVYEIPAEFENDSTAYYEIDEAFSMTANGGAAIETDYQAPAAFKDEASDSHAEFAVENEADETENLTAINGAQHEQEIDEAEFRFTDEEEDDEAAEKTACPFCSRENDPLTFVCPSCMAVLTLSDLEMLLAHADANREIVRQAVERMEAEKESADFGADDLKILAIGRINLKQLRQGLAYLRQAVEMNPNDVVLSAQTNALAIRLSEIEEQESIHSTMPKNKTILVVDDSATVRKLISGKLEKSGHSVYCAVDGMDALEKIEELLPDLILLDINMPRMDGYTVCKMIRTNDKTKDVPVVMISGKDGFFDKVRGRMAGTTGYITKPFGPETLMKTVENYIV